MPDYGPRIVTDGLILCLDASNPKSYPGSGTTWYDITGRANGTIAGTISFVSAGPQSYFNFATANDSNYIESANISQTYLDMTIAFWPDFSRVGNASVAGLIATSTAAGLLDKSLRLRNVNGTGPWTIANAGTTDLNDWTYNTTTNYYLNGTPSATTLVSGWNILGGYRTNQNPFPSSFRYYLGSSGYTSRGFQGRLAYVAMYNRQLTDQDHLQNYGALKSRFGL
jgi:hypothetical protein